MKLSTLYCLVFLLLMFSDRASGQLTVRILDAPATVFSYEPVFVTFEARNEGREPILVPTEGCGEQGSRLQLARRGELLKDQCLTAHSEARTFAWLLPGDRRLFSTPSISLGYEGLYEIEAVVRSPGECIGSLVGTVRLPLPPYREIEYVGRRFACWEGEARSQRIFVNVEVPTSEVDRAAAKHLGVPILGNWLHKLILNIKHLREQFPTSHYTYAAGQHGAGALGLLSAAVAQPDNPLNRFAVGAMEVQIARLTVPCMRVSALQELQPESWWQLYETLRGSHEPPQSMKDYVEQVKRDGAAEECPEKTADPTAGSNATEPRKSTQPSSPGTAGTASPQKQQPAQPTPSAPLSSYPSPKGLGTPNMGFRTRLSLSMASTERIFWLSLPYRYTPPDVGTPGVVDAEDLCADLDTDAALGIQRWNEPTSTFIEHPCGGPSPFALTKGTGYGVRFAPNYHVDAILSGGHDDAFTFSIPPTGGSQMSWISLPYHLRRTNPLPGAFTAEDLCQQIGSSEVRAIVRHDTETGIFHTYVCGSTFQTPFLIRNLQAYGVINKPGQTIAWLPEHY